MARKLPAEVLKSRGSFDKNPNRTRVDVPVVGDLGNVPLYFDDAQGEVWEELKAMIPPGLAKNADRWIAEIAARLMLKLRTQGLNSSELAQLINALGRLGCTPSDRAKCATAVQPKAGTNEFNEF
jgi:hypothetical protein